MDDYEHYETYQQENDVIDFGSCKELLPISKDVEATVNGYNEIVYYVNATTGSDENDGLSADTPFLTIDKAISLSSLKTNSYVVNIASGDYTINTTKVIYGGALSLIGPDYEGDTPSVSISGAYYVYSIYNIKNIKFNMGIRIYSYSSIFNKAIYENCIFTYSSGIGSAIYSLSNGLCRHTYINCTFEDGDASNVYGYAVRFPINAVFDNCNFTSTKSYALSYEMLNSINNKFQFTLFKNMYISDYTFSSSYANKASCLQFDNCTFQSTNSLANAINSDNANGLYPRVQIDLNDGINIGITSTNTFFKKFMNFYNDALNARTAYNLQTGNYSRIKNLIYSPINAVMYSNRLINNEEYVRISVDKRICNSSAYPYPMLRFYVDNTNKKKISFNFNTVNGIDEANKLTFCILDGIEYCVNRRAKDHYELYGTSKFEFEFEPENIGDYYLIFNSKCNLPMPRQYTFEFDISKLTIEDV